MAGSTIGEVLGNGPVYSQIPRIPEKTDLFTRVMAAFQRISDFFARISPFSTTSTSLENVHIEINKTQENCKLFKDTISPVLEKMTELVREIEKELEILEKMAEDQLVEEAPLKAVREQITEVKGHLKKAQDKISHSENLICNEDRLTSMLNVSKSDGNDVIIRVQNVYSEIENSISKKNKIQGIISFWVQQIQKEKKVLEKEKIAQQPPLTASESEEIRNQLDAAEELVRSAEPLDFESLQKLEHDLWILRVFGVGKLRPGEDKNLESLKRVRILLDEIDSKIANIKFEEAEKLVGSAELCFDRFQNMRDLDVFLIKLNDLDLKAFESIKKKNVDSLKFRIKSVSDKNNDLTKFNEFESKLTQCQFDFLLNPSLEGFQRLSGELKKIDLTNLKFLKNEKIESLESRVKILLSEIDEKFARLMELKNEISGFAVVSKALNKEEIATIQERLAACQEKYADEINRNPAFQNSLSTIAQKLESARLSVAQVEKKINEIEYSLLFFNFSKAKEMLLEIERLKKSAAAILIKNGGMEIKLSELKNQTQKRSNELENDLEFVIKFSNDAFNCEEELANQRKIELDNLNAVENPKWEFSFQKREWVLTPEAKKAKEAYTIAQTQIKKLTEDQRARAGRLMNIINTLPKAEKQVGMDITSLCSSLLENKEKGKRLAWLLSYYLQIEQKTSA